MSDVVIKTNNIGKLYRIGETIRHDTLRDAVSDFFVRKFKERKARKPEKEKAVWALKDISFEVKRGEIAGIIGKNGAGKTTFLKILSRITEPTEGRAEICGRVGSLLEVGTGFHPELTGRENIFLNGAVLGMAKREIKSKFDEIVAFAEVEKFIDTPVKRFSSGMYMRLAFAVAAHLDPEILLVDEVLAVGDAAFQKKCLGKMEDVAEGGRTVLFVSHNMRAVRNLCKRCILFDNARIVMDGDTNEVINRYLTASEEEMSGTMDTSCLSRPEGHGVKLRIKQVRILNTEGKAEIPVGSPLELEFLVEVREAVENISVGLGVFTPDGIKLIGTSSAVDRGLYPGLEKGVYRIRAKMEPFCLSSGTYFLGMDVRSERERLDFLRQFFSFKVLETRSFETNWFKGKDGYILSKFNWEMNKLSG